MTTTAQAGRADREMRGLRKSVSRALGDAFAYTFLIVVGVIILVPVAWMLSTAVKSDGNVYLFPPQWIPIPPHWENFTRAFRAVPFGRFFLNTVVITLTGITGALISCPLVAYAFARLRCRAKNVLFVMVLATMMLPGQVTMVPLYILYRRLNWIGTFAPLVVPTFLGNAYYIFLLRQFFSTIPRPLDDAATIDGCGYIGRFTRIILPLSKPALATVAIFSFMHHWNDFMTPMIYLSSSRTRWTMTMGLNGFRGAYGGTQWNMLMAASLVSVIPPLLLFFFAQRFFIQGIVITGVKG
jgi:ABC-type glycerol-3-phosphate transport system permease component